MERSLGTRLGKVKPSKRDSFWGKNRIQTGLKQKMLCGCQGETEGRIFPGKNSFIPS
jgi:hypothetical protein